MSEKKGRKERDILLDDDEDVDEGVKMTAKAAKDDPALAARFKDDLTIVPDSPDDTYAMGESLILDIVKNHEAPRMSKKELVEFIDEKVYGPSKEFKKGFIDKHIKENTSKKQYLKLMTEAVKGSEPFVIHPDTMSMVKSGMHSFRGNPSIPQEDNQGDFLTSLLGSRFKTVRNRAMSNTGMNHIEKYGKSFGKDLAKVLKFEQSHAESLEALALRLVEDEFDQYDLSDLIDFKADLTSDTDIDMGDQMDEQEYEYHSFQHKNQVAGEKHKKRMLDCMSYGSAMDVAYVFNKYKDELDEINPNLFHLYSKVLSFNDYMMWSQPVEDKSRLANKSGCVLVMSPDDEKNPSNKYVVIAKGSIFPILIHELHKGVMLALSMEHGLPHKDKDMSRHISCGDITSDEPWYMMVGPQIWSKFNKLVNDSGNRNIKYDLFTKLARKPADKFHSFMNEMLAGHRIAREQIDEMANDIKRK